METNYPAAGITAVSNSRTQKPHIDAQARKRSLGNLEVVTPGNMPSDDLLLYFQRDVGILEHWHVPGWHYSLTSEAWLQNMDRHRADLMPLLANTYGAAQALRWWVYGRVFFMSCADPWGCDGGREWLVSHYLFEKR
jgi:cyclopropane-fatty-acyl-phospholipid synthase